MRALASHIALAAAAVWSLAASATPATGMSFGLGAEGDCAVRACVVARGEIDERSADELRAFVRRHQIPRGARVVLDSRGGIVSQGLELGAYIRRKGFSTHVGADAAAPRRASMRSSAAMSGRSAGAAGSASTR